MTNLPDSDEVTARLAAVRRVVLASAPSRRVVHPRRLALILSASAVGVIGLTAGAIAVVQASHEQITYSVACYAHDSVSGPVNMVGEPQGIDNAGHAAPRTPTNPITTCADMWRKGIVGQPAPPKDPNAANFPVPELVGCTMVNGIGAGFPREGSTASASDFCSGLGLTVWRG
jgi:hypothetical protein